MSNTHQPILNDGQKAFVISICEEKIAAAEQFIAEMTAEYDKEKDFYEQAKRQFEELDQKMQAYHMTISRAQDVINVERGLKLNPDVEIQIAVAAKRKPYKQAVKWFPIITRILKKQDRFMTFEDLWEYLSVDPEIVKSYEGARTKIWHAKTAVLASIKGHLDNPRQDHQKLLVTYRSKHFGLPEWLEQGRLVFAQHAKQFVDTTAPVLPMIPAASVTVAARRATTGRRHTRS